MYKVGDILTLVESTNIENLYVKAKKDIRIGHDDIKDGEKVMFDASSLASRENFRKNYPNNKIVRKNADVILVNKYTFDTNYKSLDNIFLDMTTSTWTRRYSNRLTEVTLNNVTCGKVNSILERIEEYKKPNRYTSDSILVFKEPIVREIEGNELDKIRQLFQSADKEMHNLAWRLLLSFDFETNHEKYALGILSKPFHVKFPNKREFDNIRYKIRVKYPNLRL